MPIGFNIFGLLLGAVVMAIAAKNGSVRLYGIGIVVFGLACFGFGGNIS